MQKPIVVVGSINIDLVAGADRIPQVGETVFGQSFNAFHGGKGANQAVAAAKLGYPVAMVGNVGDDTFGTQLRGGLKTAGVNIDSVATVAGPSGVALITTDARGENSIVVVPGANGQLTPERLEQAMPILRSAGLLLTQLEIPLETVTYLAEFAEVQGIPLILDPAPARELSGKLLGRVSWITPNETETAELLKTNFEKNDGDGIFLAAAERFLNLGIKNVLLKLGSRGSLIAHSTDPIEHVPAFSVNAVDTTGAGDAFNAGFAVGLSRGFTPIRSAHYASAVAAISVMRPGAQSSMPTGVEVDSFLQEQSIATTKQPG